MPLQRTDYDFWQTGDLRRSRAIRSCSFIEHSYAHDNTNWWAPNERVRRRHAPQPPGSASRRNPEDGGVHLPPRPNSADARYGAVYPARKKDTMLKEDGP